jgi:galactitol-specific phosphotransferase system IIB component
MTIEEILQEWDIDSEMDDNHIDNESIKMKRWKLL